MKTDLEVLELLANPPNDFWKGWALLYKGIRNNDPAVIKFMTDWAEEWSNRPSPLLTLLDAPKPSEPKFNPKETK